jgi:hypothetical protein
VSGGQRPGEDDIVVEGAADVELALGDRLEAILAVKGDRALVAGIDAEQQPPTMLIRPASANSPRLCAISSGLS